MLIVLLSNIVNASNLKKFVFLSNQKCMTQTSFVNLYHYEYSHKFHYCPVAVKLDRFVGRCNSLTDLSNKICVLNKTEDLNLSVFNITVINESKALAKYILCECKCRFDGRKCNSDPCEKNNKCRCDSKKRHYVK